MATVWLMLALTGCVGVPIRGHAKDVQVTPIYRSLTSESENPRYIHPEPLTFNEVYVNGEIEQAFLESRSASSRKSWEQDKVAMAEHFREALLGAEARRRLPTAVPPPDAWRLRTQVRNINPGFSFFFGGMPTTVTITAQIVDQNDVIWEEVDLQVEITAGSGMYSSIGGRLRVAANELGAVARNLFKVRQRSSTVVLAGSPSEQAAKADLDKTRQPSEDPTVAIGNEPERLSDLPSSPRAILGLRLGGSFGSVPDYRLGSNTDALDGLTPVLEIDMAVRVSTNHRLYLGIPLSIAFPTDATLVTVPIGLSYIAHLGRGFSLVPRFSLGYGLFSTRASGSSKSYSHFAVLWPTIGLNFALSKHLRLSADFLSVPIFANASGAIAEARLQAGINAAF